MPEFDEAMVERLAKEAYIGWFVGDEKTNADTRTKLGATAGDLTQAAESYWRRNKLVSGGKESWPPAVRAVLAALSQTHAIVPKAEYRGLRDVAQMARTIAANSAGCSTKSGYADVDHRYLDTLWNRLNTLKTDEEAPPDVR